MQDNTSSGEQNSSAYISVLRNHRWMGKRFFLDDDGQLQKQANGLFSKGYVKVQNASCAQELATLAQSLTPQDAFCLGQPRGVNIFSAAPVATRQTQQALANRSVPILSRTKDDFSFALRKCFCVIVHMRQTMKHNIFKLYFFILLIIRNIDIFKVFKYF